MRNFIINKLRQTTGLKLSIGHIKVGIISSFIDIKNLKVYNPEGFPGRIMAELPRIYIHYNLASLIKGKAYISELRIHLKNFTIVKNADGVLNISSIKAIAGIEKKAGIEKYRSIPIYIDYLKLNIVTVVYKDYAQGEPPRIQEFNINLDESYEHITDLSVLVKIVIAQALAKASIDKLANINLSIITDNLPTPLKEGARVISEGAKEAARQGVGIVTKTIRKITDSLK